jgi:hypothetical protein
MNLYNITSEYRRILEEFQDADTPERIDELTELLSSQQDALETKAEGYCQIIKTLQYTAEAFKAEEERIRTRRQYMEAAADRLKRRLEMELVSLDIDNLDAGTFKLRIQQNNPSVCVEDEGAIPVGYFIPVAPKLDKKGILEALKAGDDVPGCSIQRTRSIRIK